VRKNLEIIAGGLILTCMAFGWLALFVCWAIPSMLWQGYRESRVPDYD
jgi:hypothetical protein